MREAPVFVADLGSSMISAGCPVPGLVRVNLGFLMIDVPFPNELEHP